MTLTDTEGGGRQRCAVCGDVALGSVGDLGFCCLEHELEHFDGQPVRSLHAGTEHTEKEDK